MKPSGKSQARLFRVALAAITLLAVIPRYLVHLGRYVDFDGYWHVWIAGQDTWKNFLWEYRDCAHPPLYYLLMRIVLLLGPFHLVYRILSLVPGIAGIYILGKTAAKAMFSPLVAIAAAIAYALSFAAIEISDAVRAYMLATCLIQLSFYYFLDLVSNPQSGFTRTRLLFGAAAILACGMEYFSVFYIVAAMAVAFAFAFSRDANERIPAIKREAVTFAVILIPVVTEYVLHFGARKMAYDHLPGFYYVPSGNELAGDYLFRTFKAELNLFLPWFVRYGISYYRWIIALVAGTGFLLLLTSSREEKNRGARASLMLPVLILGILMLGGVADAYPFGGFLRQQFILFPFALVCPFLLADRLLSRIPRYAALSAAYFLLIAVTWHGIAAFRKYPMDRTELFSAQMKHFDHEFPAPDAVYLDRINLISFFIHHHDWDWKFKGLSSDGKLALYRASKNGRSFSVVFDRDQRYADPHNVNIYRGVAVALYTWKLRSVTIFHIGLAYNLTSREEISDYRMKITSLGADQKLCAQKIDTNGLDVNAEFRAAGTCDIAPLAQQN